MLVRATYWCGFAPRCAVGAGAGAAAPRAAASRASTASASADVTTPSGSPFALRRLTMLLLPRRPAREGGRDARVEANPDSNDLGARREQGWYHKAWDGAASTPKDQRQLPWLG